MESRPSTLYHQYSRHVSGALSPDKLEFYREYPDYVKKRFPRLESNWFVDITKGSHLGVKIFPWLESHIRSHEPVIEPTFNDLWTLTWTTVTESIELQINALTRELVNSQPEYFLDILRKLEQSDRLLKAAKTKIFIINVHHEIEQESEKGGKSFRISILPNIEFVGDLVVLHHFPGNPIIITYQMFVNSLDKLEAQFSWLFYVLYMSEHPTRKNMGTLELFDQIYTVLETAYTSVGNEAIRVCKLLEPLLVGISLQSLDPKTHDHQFGNIIRDSFIDDHKELHPFVLQIWDIGKNYLAKHGEIGIPYLVEQYGQEKLHNYPIVSIEGGLRKMHLYGTSIRVSEEQAVRDIASNFKREYFVAYYEKHKILPKIKDNWRLDKRIKRLITRGRPGSIRECYRIPNEAWFSLEFEKNHEFNYFPQISDLLDDKAITPHLLSIYQLFAWDALDVMNVKKPYTQENTRLILEILDRPVIDIRSFYEEVERIGHIPKNWGIIQLMAKERELKIEARTFSILTFECRMMASACERNLGEEILPLFKQQSMTLTGSELKHKMDILSTLPETDDYIWIAFMNDLQQWNYTFRSFQQAYLINVLCDLFGVSHFRYLMNIFTDSNLISANKFTPPGFPGKFTQWDTHAGGNQGILQRLWTIITIIVIRDEMHKLDLEHRLTGSGDNQVLFVKLRKGEKLSEMIRLIKERLRLAFERIGLALKLEETWTSRELICYQRKYYYKGVLVPGGIKISARAFSGTGDINAGINAIVTTAINGGVALTEQHSDPIIGPSFAYSEIFLNLLGHNEWKLHTPHQVRPLVLLSMLSSDYGFLPCIQLTGFLYAGHQDTLSESLALLNDLWKSKPEYRAYISGAVRFKMGERDLDAKLQLILDPTTLNIDRPRLPEAIIRSNVENFLMTPQNVRNNQLRLMFACCKKEDQLKLADELLKIRPINTALLHSLFEYSHIGSLLGTLSRFNKISSIVRLVGMNKVGDRDVCFSRRVRELDIANLKYFFRRIKPRHNYGSDFISEVISCDPNYYHNYCRVNNLFPQCVFSARLFLIAYSYGLGYDFITGPYTPPPSEQLIFHDKGVPLNTESTLIVNPCYNIPEHIHQLETCRGSYNLYIGSRTSDPVRTIKLTTLDGVEAGTAIKTLLKILAWMKSTKSDTNILNFITTQLGSRMEGLEDIIPGLVPGTAGGCIDHRFGSPGTVMWAYSNSTSIVSTWYQITSNRATLLQRGKEDRFVFFQQLFHHIYSALRFCKPYTKRFGVIVRLDHCSYSIPESQFRSPPIYLPGQEKLLGGLVLDPARKDALRTEANHYQNVMLSSILTKGSGEEILSAVIGHQISQNVMMYSMGLEDLNNEEHKLQLNQTSINLSILRKIPLKKLLSSLAIHLGVMGYFGRRINPAKLIKRLQSRGRLGAATQSMTPFLDIIQAIITGGYLPQLLSYTKSYWKWNSNLSLINLIGPLMEGMALSIIEWQQDQYPIYILTEVKGSQFNYTRLIQFFQSWNSLLNRVIQLNQDLSGVRLIEEINSSYWALQVLLVTDKGIATEYGRRKLEDLEYIGDTLDPLPSTPLNQPNLLTTSVPPWISISLTSAIMEPSDLEDLKNIIEGRKSWSMSTTNASKFMKWNKAISSGKYKLCEILTRLSVTLPEETLNICLAEGPGSFLSFLLHHQPKSLGVYNSKVRPETTPPAMAGLYIPPELLCSCNLQSRAINLPELSAGYGDLTLEITWEELNHHVRDHPTRSRILTFDMEFIPYQTLIIIKTLTRWIKVWQPIVAIIKISLEVLTEPSGNWLNDLCKHYRLCSWIKPTMSNPYSTEVYLVLQYYMPDPQLNSDYTLKSLITEWSLIPWMLTKQLMGKTLIESMAVNLDSNYCPNYLQSLNIRSSELFGSLWSLLYEPFIYVFKSIYTKYWLIRELDRTEQVVLHSQSVQSESIRNKFHAITKALELYILMRGSLMSVASHPAMHSYIEHHADEFLTVLDKAENDLPIKASWDETMQILGFLMSSPDSFQLEGTRELILAWVWLSLNDDKFLIFKHYPNLSRQLLYDSIKGTARTSHLNWLDLLLRPANFFLINHVLEEFIESINWETCHITHRSPNIQQIIDDLPWLPKLSQSGSNTLEIANSINDDTSPPSRDNSKLTIVLTMVRPLEVLGSQAGILAFSKNVENGSINIYSKHHI